MFPSGDDAPWAHRSPWPWVATAALFVAGALLPGAAAEMASRNGIRPAHHLVILSPHDGDLIGDNTPTVAGTGPAEYQVSVISGKATLCTVRVATNGSWSCQPKTGLADGVHTVEPSGTDGSGERVTGPPISFTVDTAAPQPPVVRYPAPNATVNDNTPTFRGTAEPAGAVAVAAGHRAVCTATADRSGSWSCTSTALPDGPHKISATATDVAGNSSAATELTIAVDRHPPAAPTITSPGAGAAINDSTPTIAGTGEPGTIATVTRGGPDALCRAPVRADGHWSCPVDGPLAEGPVRLMPRATDSAGNSTTGSPVTVTVDITAPKPPSIRTPAHGSTASDPKPAVAGTAEPGATVAITDGSATTRCTAGVLEDGSFTCTPTADLPEGTATLQPTVTDPAGNSNTGEPIRVVIDTTAPTPPTITTPAPGSAINDNTPTISGTAEAGLVVSVRDLTDGRICTATATRAGTWSCQPASALPEGVATLRSAAADRAGNTVTGAPVRFTVDTTPPTDPGITTPADGSSTKDSTPTVAGTGEPGSRVSVAGAADGTLCDAVVRSDGRWSCSPEAPMADGRHPLRPSAVDRAGNAANGQPVTITVDTVPPTAPKITSPNDGATVNQNPVRFAGQAEPGAAVVVSRPDQTALCRTEAAPDGTWSCRSPMLPQGETTARPVATDRAGNTAPGDPVSFRIDSIPPAPPSIGKPADGSTIRDNTPSFSGATEPGTTVAVTDGTGRVICAASAAGDGTWTCITNMVLADGRYIFTATAADQAGNRRSGPAITVTIDADGCGCSTTGRPQRPIAGRRE